MSPESSLEQSQEWFHLCFLVTEQREGPFLQSCKSSLST